MRTRCGLGLALLVTPAGLSAASFAVNEMSARAQGMGGAFTSIADDASALFFNPAGIAFQKGTNLQMEMLVINGQFRFVPNPSEAPPGLAVPAKGFSGAISQPFIPVASLYAARRLSEKVAVGFAIFIPNGLGDNWTNFNDSDPANTKFSGRFAGSRALLQQYWFQPTVAYRLTSNQAISLGVAFVHTHLLLEQSFLNPYDTKPTAIGFKLAQDVFPGVDPQLAYNSFARLLPEGRLRAAATANKYGITAGYMYKHRASGINIGLMYRSHVVSHLKGKAAFAFAGSSALVPFLPKDRGLDVVFPNQDIAATFTTPATYALGVSKRGVAGGTLAFDVRMQQFDRFQDLPINFSKNVDSKGRPTGTEAEQRLTFNFHNAYMFQAGYERPFGNGKGMMGRMTEGATWRAGYIYDGAPTPEKSIGPLFPDTSRHSWTAGMTKPVRNFDMTFFYQFMQFLNVTTNVAANRNQFTNGEYRSFANIIGLGMRWRVGGHDGKVE